jgi:hypothetical protein
MAFEELKQDIMEVNADIKSYLANSEEYLRLKLFKLYMVSLTSFAQILVLGALLLVAVIFLSTAASIALGYWLDNTLYGFLIVGLCYTALWTLVFIFRERIERPVIRKFSKHFFDQE